MWNILCIIFPTFITMKIEEKYLTTLKIKDYIANFCIYCLLNNIVVTTIFCLLFGSQNISDNLEIFSGFAVKYGLIALCVAFGIAILKIIIVKNLEVKVETQNKKDN